jgi:hypothetical protein
MDGIKTDKYRLISDKGEIYIKPVSKISSTVSRDKNRLEKGKLKNPKNK